MSPFKAYLIEEQEGVTRAGFVTMDESQLDPGEVTIKVAYSSVNYKDALAATGSRPHHPPLPLCRRHRPLGDRHQQQ
jgi:NADPH:quinone reductase-like Zn-dependent oxidoreductase